MINPRYDIELKDVIKLHEIETVDTRTIINEMVTKFYNYTVVGDLAGKPCTAPLSVTTANCSIYLNDDTVG